MTDCSCEGFTEIVKSWLAGGRFFFLFLSLLFLSSPFFDRVERKRGRDRKGRSVEWQEFRSLSHLVSFLAFRFIWLRSFRLLPLRSPTVRREKKSHSRCLEAAGRNVRLCSYKHTFLLVLTCISKPLTRSSWKQIRYTCKCAHTHARRGKCTNTTHSGPAMMSPHPSPPVSLYEVQRVLFFGHVETSGLDWLLELNIGHCSVSCCSFTLPPPSRAKDCKVKRGLILLWYSRPQDALLYKKSMSFIWACSHPLQKNSFIRFPVHRKEECDVGQLIWISYFLFSAFVTVSPCFSFSFFEGLSFGYCISPTGGWKKCEEEEVECWVMGEAAVT